MHKLYISAVLQYFASRRVFSDCHLRVQAAAVLNQEQQPMPVAALCGLFVPHLQYHPCSWFLTAAFRCRLQAHRRHLQLSAEAPGTRKR